METIEIIAIILSLLFGWEKVDDQIAQKVATLEDVVDHKEREILVAINDLNASQTRFDDRLASFRRSLTKLDSAYENLDMSQSRYVELVGEQIAILSAEAKHLADSYAQLDQALAQKLNSHANRTEQLRTDLNASPSIEVPFSEEATRRFASQQAKLVSQRNEISSQQALIEELRQQRTRLEEQLEDANKQVGSKTESLSKLGDELEVAKAEKKKLAEDKSEAEDQSQKHVAKVASLNQQNAELEEWRDLLGGGAAFGTLLSALFGTLFGKRRGDTVQYRRAFTNLLKCDHVDHDTIVNTLLAQECKRIPREYQMAQSVNQRTSGGNQEQT